MDSFPARPFDKINLDCKKGSFSQTSMNNYIRIPPTLRPGSKIKAKGKGSGTLGPFALTSEGDIVLTFTRHQVEDSKGPLYLEPEMIPVSGKIKDMKIGFDCSLKLKDVFDELPTVLKKPIEPERGRTILKVGMKTGVTYGKVDSICANPKVDMGDGRIVEMKDMIEVIAIDKINNIFSEGGDSGAYGLTLTTLEPVGLLSCREPNEQKKAYFVKLTKMQQDFSLQGFYAPLSLPPYTPPELKLVISSFLPDGLFLQKSNLQEKASRVLMSELGIKKIERTANSFKAHYEDMFVTTNPFMPGDAGSYLTNQNNKLIGLAVAGNNNTTVAMKIQRVMDALDLELIQNINQKSFSILLRSSFWRTRCQNPSCNLIIPPTADNCPFCNTKQ